MTPEQIAAIVSAAVAEALSQPGSGVKVEADEPKPKRGRKADTTKGTKPKVYRWAPWACARFGIPTKVGGTFDYTSARNGETHKHKVTKVASDGKVESVRV